MKTIELTRRQFLKTTGGLIVSFNLVSLAPAFAQSTVGPGMDADPTQLDSWLAVAPDGTVTVFSGKVDLGTGVETALAQIVAEELDVPFNRIHMIGLDTNKAINQGTTSGSRTIERGGPQLRQAAAAARQELLKLAAAQLNSPVEKLTVTDGVVSDGAKKISYGQLIGGKKFNVKITATGTGWDMKVAPEVRAKDVKDHKIVGTSQKRIDLPAKLTGEFSYANDVRIPGMLHGRVVRPPTITSKPANIDESSVKNIPGLVKIVQEGSFVGVVCETEWAAIRAAKALKVSWSQPPTKMPASADELFAYIKDTKSLNDQVTVNKGNPDSALAQAKKTYEATYRWPFQMHGMMGPPCAVADFAKDQITIYTGTQGSFETRKAVAELLGFPGIQRSRALSRSLRQLWSHGRRRCRRRRGTHVTRGGQTGARAVDARRRTWLGAQRPGAVGSHPRGHRRRWQDHRLGLCRSRISPHCCFGPRLAPARFAPDRHETHGQRQFQRHPRRRRDVFVRKSKMRRAVDPVGASRRDSAAHRLPARAGRYGALLRQRIVHR